MFNEPMSVAHDGATLTLNRIGTSTPERLGRFVASDGAFTLDIRQDKSTNRFRREMRLTRVKTAADPITAINKEVSASCIVVVDEPKFGFTDVELANLLTAILAEVGETSNRTKLLQGEN